MTEIIRQEIDLPASPERVYKALTDSKQFSAFTGGASADIAATAGGAFSSFGGMISGRMLDLVPNERIVQAWRAGNWDAGAYSIVRFDLTPQSRGTRLTLTQSGHPEGSDEHLKAGWPKMYFDPLKKFLS